MRAKIQAATVFIHAGGRRAVITAIEAIEDAVAGRTGTEITRG